MKRALLLIAIVALATPAHGKTMFSDAKSADEAQQRLDKLPEGDGSLKKAVLLSDKGTMLYREGKMVEASQAFEACLTNRTTRVLRRHVFLFLGKSYESSGRLDKAISAYQEALVLDPKNWRRHRDLAGLYEQAQLYRKAQDFYASAVKLNPREPSLHFVSGRVLREMGLYKEAEPFLAKAGELGYDDRAIRREKSLIFEHRGRFGDSLEEWKRAAGDSEAPEDIARLIYLSVLVNDQTGARTALARLKTAGASPETVELYENLVQLGPSGLETLLSSRGRYPEIEALVGSYLASRSSPNSLTGQP